MQIDADRLREDIERNAAFGAIASAAGRGRTVLTGTEANRQAREQFVERLEAAELTVRVDAVGNILGVWDATATDPDAAPIVAGSHLDSVPEGGIFDGPLGVYGALEAVRAMQDAGIEPTRPVGVVSFTEEEGTRFGGGLLGSSVAAGMESVDAALARTDDAGTTLEAALESIGFAGTGRLDAAAWDAFCELHIEQDSVLEDAGAAVGVVTAIAGICHVEATIVGEANHAGATPMGDRTDALAAAAGVILEVEETANGIVESMSPSAVGTVGRCTVSPNATNVVPGRVELGVDIRDVDRDAMDVQLDALDAHLAAVERERGVETAHRRVTDVDPEAMSERVRSAFEAAAVTRELATRSLASGAAHDTMNVARVTDAGLLFAPSRDGISHNPREWTEWADCADATQVLADAMVDLAT